MSQVLVLAGSVRFAPAAHRALVSWLEQSAVPLGAPTAQAPPLHSAMVSPAFIALKALITADQDCLGADATVPAFESFPATHPAWAPAAQSQK